MFRVKFEAFERNACFKLLWLIFFCISTLQGQAEIVTTLRDRLQHIFSDPELAHAQVGAMVSFVHKNKVIFSLNEKKSFLSASTLKLFTASFALDELGKEFRFETKLYYNGTIENGTLHGDLIVVGGGDPSINYFYRENQDTTLFLKDWADAVSAAGINKVDGLLLADISLFGGETVPTGWEWNDEPFDYFPQINALSFNNNCITLLIKPAKESNTLSSVKLVPDIGYLKVENRVNTVEAKANTVLEVNRKRGVNSKAYITGQIALDSSTRHEGITVKKPHILFLQSFREKLKQHKIQICGKSKTLKMPKNYYGKNTHLLATYQSPPLIELVSHMLKKSDNLYAELIMKRLQVNMIRSSSKEKLTALLNTYLKRIPIDPYSLNMADASGGRQSFVTPESIILLLNYLSKRPFFEKFKQCLPIGGVDGTLQNRFINTPAYKQVFAKTGSLNGVRTLAGYVYTKNRELVAFAFMINNSKLEGPKINALIDKAVIEIAREI
ncbi:MAG: D-alanyl-D-alanine carboxypeptidase/D-alanyl-D-alanine-endopeptidase [Verrucomicrobia bacterium GWC2_42_7]|nr:MAG: D-alanyl-D-alanine carboxypeptidase/D-alanyl-D-alanine-endopeptidase [Verrucomicrobia bacterium GWC2_42_7]